MNAIISALVILGFVDWSEILRDAQSTNKANLRQGEASVTLRYTPPKSLNDRDVIVQADVQWLDENLIERYRFQSFADFPFARKNPQTPEDSEWSYYARNSTSEMIYNPQAKIFAIDRISVAGIATPVLDFHPWDSWFRCCPPNVRNGRPWSEMIDLIVTEKDGRKSSLEFNQTDKDTIRQIRSDPNGRKVEIDYSLTQGSNVVRIESTPEPSSREIFRGKYKWRPLGNSFVLDSCRFERSSMRPKNPDEIEIYELTVKSVQLRPVDPSIFSKSHLMSLLPQSGIKINDRVNNQFIRIPAPPLVDDGQLRSLSDTLRARGFAKPD